MRSTRWIVGTGSVPAAGARIVAFCDPQTGTLTFPTHIDLNHGRNHMFGKQWLVAALSLTAVLSAFGSGAHAQSCIDSGCVALMPNHITPSQIPFVGANKQLDVRVGATTAAGARVLAFCDRITKTVRAPVTSGGQFIQLNAGDALPFNISICMNAPSTPPSPTVSRTMTFVSTNETCFDQNGVPLKVFSPIKLAGKKIVISTGGAATVNVTTLDTVGTVQMCGGNGINFFHAARTGVALLEGFGSQDLLQISGSFAGGSLLGGTGDDILFGNAVGFCDGGPNNDTCQNCNATSSCNP